MDLQLPGNVSAVCDDSMRGKEQAVGDLAVRHSLDNTDNDFLFACAECLLFFIFGLFSRWRVEKLQFMAQLVRTVVYADLLVVRTEQRVIGDGIQQGDAFHLRADRRRCDGS